MADFFFFTDLDAIAPQTPIQAFGPAPNDSLSFRVNNHFQVTQDAAAIAITDGIPMVQQCDTEPECVNVVLFPIKNIDFDFPAIKLFIYRGIKKESLFETDGNLKTPDSDWKTNNILKVLKDLQDKLNADNGTSETAKAENLGYHYSDSTDTENFKSNSEFVERIIFLNDGLQLPLVKAGCQLGQFIGGTENLAGFQIVLDRIGYEPTLGLVRAADSVVTVTMLTENTEIAKFQQRHEKEDILTYADITALLGTAHYNKTKIKAYANEADKKGSRTNSLELLNPFFNKNVCYIDIRGNYSYSYNHFENFKNNIKLEFLIPNSEEVEELQLNYYKNWPILMLRNRPSQSGNPNENIKIYLPIKDSDRINADYFLQSYTHKFIEKSEATRFIKCNDFDDLLTVRNEFCEAITIKTWVNNEKILGANLFFFKFTKTQNSLANTDIFTRSGPYDAVFPTNIKLLLGDNDLDDADFKVFLYSPENAPIVFKNQEDFSNTLYSQYVGMAQDKHNTTFFSFAHQIAYEPGKRTLKYPMALVQNGKYENAAFLDEFEYDPASENLGFLTVLPKRVLASSLKLQKPRILFEGELTDFLYYLNTEPQVDNKFSIDPKKFHAITVTNNEYNLISTLTEQEFDTRYPTYLHIDHELKKMVNREYYSFGKTVLKLVGLSFDINEDKIITKEVVVEDDNAPNENITLNFFVNKS
jgi:hypothetical protein